MRFLRVFFLTAFLSVGISAQQLTTVTGRLVDQGRVVANQSIRLVSSVESFDTQTDADGTYRFDNVPDGRYLLVHGSKRANVIVKNGQVSTAELAEVVIVAANETQTVDQVSKSIDVITGQEMRDRADFSLIESLRTIPGFRVQQSGGFGRVATIKTRGLRNQDTAILIDGIRFRDVSAITGDASSFLSDFTLTSVSKVEVLRGSGSSVYGTNAIGGTVDFRTPEARRGTHGQLSGAAGGLGLGRFRGNLSHGAENGKFGINAGVSRTTYTKGIDGDDEANNTNLQTRIDANPFSKTSISGRIFYANADVRLNSGPDTLGTLPPTSATIIDAQPNVNFLSDVNDPDNIQRSRFFSGQFVVDQVVNSNLVLSGYYQGLKTKRTNDNGTLGAGFQSASTSIFEGTIHTGNAHVRWTPDDHNQITAGYEFESERFGNDGSTPGGTGNYFTRAGQKSNSIYVQDLVNLADGRLQLAGSARFQRFSLDRPEFSLDNAPYSNLTLDDPPAAYTFDGAASYFFRSSGTKIRAHVGNGYRVPSLYERFGSYFFFNSFFPLGNPELKPERSIGIDGGIEQSFAGDRLKLSGTYFYTKINDEISYLPTDDLGAPSYYNFDKHFSRGVEFSVSHKPTGSTSIFWSYTFTNSDVRVHRRPAFPVGPVSSTDRSAYGVPDHQFTLVATQRFKRFWVNFDFLATSTYLAPIFSNSTFNTYVYRFGGNRKGDLTAGYTFGINKEKMTLRLYGTIENVFDHEYYENGFRTAGATGRIGLTFGF